MIEVRNYEGTAEELSAFIISIWRNSYAGKMAFPLWTPEYLDWHFGFSTGAPRDHLLAAWIDGQLAGVLLGDQCSFRRATERNQGLISSWLSVLPQFRGQGVVKALKAEQDRRMLAAGDGIILAYRYFGSGHSLSKGPTDEQLKSGRWDSRRVGFWVRILDPGRAAKWYLSPFQRRITALGAPFTLSPRATHGRHVIRPWRADDLASAVALLDGSAGPLSFSIDWTPDALAHHCGRFGNGLVAEENGEVRGLVTWHVLKFVGATEEPVAIFDIIAIGALSRSAQRAILNAALFDMKQNGVILALKLRTGDTPATSMLLAGFIPWFNDSFETLHAIQKPLPPALKGNHHVLWR